MVPKGAGVNLENFVVAAFVLLLSYCLTFLLASSRSRLFYLLDYPNERSLHSHPTPRIGGIAILGSLFSGLLLAYVGHGLGWFRESIWAHSDPLQMQQIQWILLLTLCIAAVSFVDDRFGVPSWIRFGVHAVVAGSVVYGLGVKIDIIAIPLLETWMLGDTAALLTIFFLMWIVNLYNFMDGMDGFAGGMTVLGFGFLSGSAWIGGNETLGALALFIAASAGGFLVYNMPPAKIFMGDIGSTSLGFLAGALSVVGISAGVFDVWVPILIFSPFIMDATATLLRRLFQGKKIWLPHREHYYQRLVLSGWGRKRTVWAEYVLMCVCGWGAILYVFLSDGAQLVLLSAWVALYGFLMTGVQIVERKFSKDDRNQ
tara:strand:+ start:9166 stop:10278 length:1113 start_codon:yes stop_codon:yes gene_type:complete